MVTELISLVMLQVSVFVGVGTCYVKVVDDGQY